MVFALIAFAPLSAQAQITEIIDVTGDGGGNGLFFAQDIAVDSAGNVYVTGTLSANAFKITPGGVITEIIDATGDGGGNVLNSPNDVAVDGSGNVYVSGDGKVFKIASLGPPIPTLSQWGVIGFGLLLLTAMFVVNRRGLQR